MTIDLLKAQITIKKNLESHSETELIASLSPKIGAVGHMPKGSSLDDVEGRWNSINKPSAKGVLGGFVTEETTHIYNNSIENLIGFTTIPVGVVGPLLINGIHANGAYHIPLATTEGALVASYHRGAQLITESGGVTVLTLSEGLRRTPGFIFKNLIEVGGFLKWFYVQHENLKSVAEATTRHGKLTDICIAVDANYVFLHFEYTTGDASGQNMVTFATEAVCQHILEHSPIKPESYFLDANMSGDKKASALSFQTVRGKKVTAEVFIPSELIEKRLHTTPQAMIEFGKIATTGGILSGTLGIQGHYSNAMAAFYLACGQDPACVAESAIGVTRYDLTKEGQLHATITLPNVMVGTVGGGTGLPSQKACLEIMGLAGPGKSLALGEVLTSLCLAGELSISGAFSAGDFARAHKVFARIKNRAIH